MSRDATMPPMENHEHVSFDLMLKATPAEEGGKRIIYFEASNEGIDQQGERVLAKALAESAAIYKAHGNIDIDHLSLLRKNQQEGIEAEIGFPVDVVINDRRTFVKAQLFAGNGPLARNANMVWSSLTEISPPARWYPSVGGSVLAKSQEVDPDTNQRVTVVSKVRWTNVALSRTPVNQNLGQVSTLPVGTFCKSLGCLVMAKTLTAGYGTDSACMTGGAALRKQSLHGATMNYFEFEDSLAEYLGRIKNKKPFLSRDGNLPDVKVLKSLAGFSAAEFGLEHDEATEMVERFFLNLVRRSCND